MSYTDLQKETFQELSAPLIKFLCENFNPHASILITPTDAEVLVGEMVFSTDKYLVD